MDSQPEQLNSQLLAVWMSPGRSHVRVVAGTYEHCLRIPGLANVARYLVYAVLTVLYTVKSIHYTIEWPTDFSYYPEYMTLLILFKV